jgi:dihydrofolate synthase/folylpolyglutamate synthase
MAVRPDGPSSADDPFLPFVRSGIRPGLSRIRRILKALNRPDRVYKGILVAGSNGKGTTAAMLAGSLQALGFCTGLFTSPHLNSVHERFQVNNRLARRSEIKRFLSLHGDTCRQVGATYFEVTTAFALWWFAQSRVDWAVLEIGLGGRWDACNAIQPDLSIITSISREHTEFLGNTLAEIAAEKARVARRGRPVLIGSLPKAAEVAARAELTRIGADTHWLETRPQRLTIKKIPSGTVVHLGAACANQNVKLSMRGHNAAAAATLASAAICTLRDTGEIQIASERFVEALKFGMSRVRWPARLQIVRRSPLTVVDVAHNPAAIESLITEWKRYWPDRRPVLLTALLSDKNPLRIGRLLARLSSRVIVTAADSPRSLSPEGLAIKWRPLFHRIGIEPDMSKAMSRARRMAGKDGAILVVGSHYLAGPILRLLKVTPFADRGRS